MAVIVLQPDGRLRLTAFEYKLDFDEWQRQGADELVVGDFWLVMKPAFSAPRTYIPFREGVVAEDRKLWHTEEPPPLAARYRSKEDGGGPA